MQYKPTVFLIDDDTDDQEIFGLALNSTNQLVDCVFANDGLDALQKLESTDFIPDFIFIDINMPRMNGQQCLSEIRKIDRFKNTPVYMYSTSIDPITASENKSMGATDFIVKPADIKVLTEILSKILNKQVLAVFLIILMSVLVPAKVYAQDTLPSVKDLKKLSVEELMNIVVTSVSKTPEKLTEVASAIQVIKGSDIRRSATMRLPEALRLASNMQVAQSGAHDWGITSRGFNGAPVTSSSLADKLLVMIDGRSVYTPLFGGVFWDVQNVMLEDVDRIEVVSGPGGTLWGSNAVNGVVNVISKNARETQGVYAAGAYGSFLKDYGAIRYGGKIDTSFFFRVYAQRYDYNSLDLPDGTDAHDDWNITQTGFRADYTSSSKNIFTFQGDYYAGEEDNSPSVSVDGQNVIGKWEHSFTQKSGLTVQTYFDRTFRDIRKQGFKDEMLTYDIDVQHNMSLGNKNKFVWGVAYRLADDYISSINNEFLPAHKQIEYLSGFLQDQISLIPDKLDLTIGSKILKNDYTDVEVQPSVRLALIPKNNHTIWAAVSRAVRTPSRYDADLTGPVLASFGEFKSEKLVAYETGYRVQPTKNSSISLSLFYNKYTDLRSIDTNSTPLPLFYFANNLEAETFGAELSARIIITSWWKLRGGYTYLSKKFSKPSPATYPRTEEFESNDPNNQVMIQTMFDIKKHLQVDGTLRYVDVLPQTIFIPKTNSYFALNIRIAYIYKFITFSVAGQNLIEDSHEEFALRSIPRHIYTKLSISF
ncbi:MAG: response regulator [Bacteroidota bacterium]